MVIEQWSGAGLIKKVWNRISLDYKKNMEPDPNSTTSDPQQFQQSTNSLIQILVRTQYPLHNKNESKNPSSGTGTAPKARRIFLCELKTCLQFYSGV
jgi:hypothetical protein